MRHHYTLLQEGKGRMEALLAVQREIRELGRLAALRRKWAPAGVVREQPQGQRHRSAWRIFNDVDIPEERMATAKVFRSGNSQAVRLPQEFRLDVDEVEIFRQDGDLVLRPGPREGGALPSVTSRSPGTALIPSAYSRDSLIPHEVNRYHRAAFFIQKLFLGSGQNG